MNTVGDILSAIRDHGFGDSANIPDARIIRAIDTAAEQLYGLEDWPFLEATPATLNLTASGVSVNLPNDFQRAIGVIWGSRKLRRLERNDYLETSVSIAATAGYDPAYYSIWGSKLYVLPATSGSGLSTSVTIWYLREAPALAVTTDTPLVPRRHLPVLMWGALSEIYSELFEADDSAALAIRAQYDKALEAMRADLVRKDADRDGAVGDSQTAARLASEVRAHGFDQLGDSIVYGLLSDVQRDIAAAWPHQFLQAGPVRVSVPAGSTSVYGPADMEKPVSIIDASDGLKLTQVRADSFIEQHNTARSGSAEYTGRPLEYTLWGYAPAASGSSTPAASGPRLRLSPVPDRAVELDVYYIKAVPAISGPTDIPVLPERWRSILVLGAVGRACLMSTERVKDAPGFKKLYDDQLERLIDDLSASHYDNTDVIEAYDIEQDIGW